MEFSSIEDMERYINQQILETMGDEVALDVKKQISNHVISDVYSRGNPKYYHRRNLTNGSLGDINSMPSNVVGGVLVIENNAQTNNRWGNEDLGNRHLADAIEYGYGDKQQWYNEARPFIANTKRDLLSNELHIHAMKKGLIKRGIKVE